MPSKIVSKPVGRVFGLDELIAALTEARKTLPGNAHVRTFSTFRGIREVTVDGDKLVEDDRMGTD